jgi:multiple antibiotic resistance protein
MILKFYGISIPVLRVAGGFIVAVAGWKLLSEGSRKELEASADGVSRTELLGLAAAVAIAITVFLCFAYADRVQRLLGPGGTDIAVRLSAFILFCLGIQILWSGGSELLKSVIHSGS